METICVGKLVAELDVMENKNNIGGYVFVACGVKEHLDTLQQSYRILRSKTQLPVYVVTDHQRNEYKIDFADVVSVNTPIDFSHHQAAIYLKTRLHKILPANKIYAYLDTDILAYGENPNDIFDAYISPITFAPDHCRMDQFSPYAVNCGCLEMLENKRSEVKQIIKQFDKLSETDDLEFIKKREKLFDAFQKAKINGRLKIAFYLKYFFSWPYFAINEEFRFDRRKKRWIDKEGTPVMYKVNMRKVARLAGLKWNFIKNEMTLKDGRNLWSNDCHHIQQQTLRKFGISIADRNWQHWNGGVFLFSGASTEFMDTWHQYSMEIFKDAEWKTRDQGTLIATVWKLGLQNHPMLDIKWNMILDYYNNCLEVFEDGSITLDGKIRSTPELIHIYHHWGDTSWTIWNRVIQMLSR